MTFLTKRSETRDFYKSEDEFTIKITFFQLNIVNEKVYELLGTLYKEMFEIFDPDVFHFGGDEVTQHFKKFI